MNKSEKLLANLTTIQQEDPVSHLLAKADASLKKLTGKARSDRASSLLALASNPAMKSLHPRIAKQLKDFEAYHAKNLDHLKLSTASSEEL